jgi:Transposase DDE domain
LLGRLVETAGRRTCVRALGGTRAGEIRLTRFLRNENVTPARMMEEASARTGLRCAGRHVLAIQDTTVVRSKGGGGLYLHAMIAVDAEDGAILGPIHGQFLNRGDGKRGTQRNRPIEEKESYRWLEGGAEAAEVCAGAAKITVIADRESDIYEVFTRRPPSVELLIRVNKDRSLRAGSLFARIDALPVTAHMQLDLPAKPGRKACKAELALRFTRLDLRRPRNGLYPGAPDATTLNLVDVREVDAPQGQPPIHWRLFTTHEVSNAAQAFAIADLYRRRWLIEQLFRTMKTQGFDIEGLRIEDDIPLCNLVMATFIAAVIVQQLVHARDGNSAQGALRPLTDAFEQEDLPLLQAFCVKLEGKTEKQKNPHPPGSLAYAAWVCARLGGWNCYYGKPGPITMLNGWRQFQAARQGVALLSGSFHNV